MCQVGHSCADQQQMLVNCLHFSAYLMPFSIHTTANHIEDSVPVIILKMLWPEILQSQLHNTG